MSALDKLSIILAAVHARESGQREGRIDTLWRVAIGAAFAYQRDYDTMSRTSCGTWLRVQQSALRALVALGDPAAIAVTKEAP